MDWASRKDEKKSLTNKQTNKDNFKKQGKQLNKQTKKWRGGESKKLKFCKKNRSGALSFDSNLKEKKRLESKWTRLFQ